MDEKPPAAAPALLGRYELGTLLGRGGMGEVREATDLRLGRVVAVKILRADLGRQPRARRRFETEARAAARLAHPNVVTVFDAAEAGDVPFLVMERLPGRTFADELQDGSVPVDRACEVAGQVLAALGAAHAAGIVHRDVKPGNVLLAGDHRVKVGDFGIAKAVDDVDQTQTTDLLATPAYLAPERLTGGPATRSSDLYSVGVLLYEALAGRRPFGGDTPVAVMLAVERGEATPLATLRPDVPAGVASVVDRAMSRDPSRRFATATDMSAALEAAVEAPAGVPVAAVATVPIARDVASSVTRTIPVARASAPEARARPRRRRALALVAAAFVAGAIAAGAVVTQHDEGHASPTIPPTTAPATTAAPLTSAATTTSTTTSTTTAPAPPTQPGPGHGHDHNHGPGHGDGGPGPGDDN